MYLSFTMINKHPLGLIFGFLLFISASNITAQDFKFSHDPGDTLIAEIQNNISTAHFIYQVNETDEPLILKWRLIENTIPEDWFLELCDNTTCYSSFPNNMIMDTIEGDVNAFLKLTVNPEGDTNPAHMTFRVSENGDDANFKIAHFQFNPMIIDNVLDEEAGDIKLFPNPCNSELFINNINTEEITNIQIINMKGQLLVTKQSDHSIDVSPLRPGSYILRVTTKDRQLSTVFEKQ